MSKKQRGVIPTYKARVALSAAMGDKTLGVHVRWQRIERTLNRNCPCRRLSGGAYAFG
jgi:hypothetical protein